MKETNHEVAGLLVCSDNHVAASYPINAPRSGKHRHSAVETAPVSDGGLGQVFKRVKANGRASEGSRDTKTEQVLAATGRQYNNT